MSEKEQQYLQLASQHTEAELAEILHIGRRTVRRYAQNTGIKPKINKYRDRTPEEWAEAFKSEYGDELILIGPMTKDSRGKLHSKCRCSTCGHEWTIHVQSKLREKTRCMRCDRGNHGNKYSEQDVENMMNQVYKDQWKLIQYGHYSQKDSVIQCTICGAKIEVKLADFIKTTTMRCTNCQTGSFGEYVIATTLRYNNVPFEREKQINVNGKKYRIDFLIDSKIGLEYSGAQHYEPGLYYNPDVNRGVELKKAWCLSQGYRFVEIRASYDIDQIIADVNNSTGLKLNRPTPEFFRTANPDIETVLTYMKTHSMRQTIKDLHVSSSKIKKYVYLSGYKSVSDWQSENKADT